MITPTDYIEDEIYGQRLLISVNAEQRELPGNIRAARAILHSFADVTIIINTHTMSFATRIQSTSLMGSWGTVRVLWARKV